MAKSNKGKLSPRQEAGLVEKDFELQPQDEAVAAGEHIDHDAVEIYGDATLLRTNSDMPYMSEEDAQVEMKASVMGPPGYGSPDPVTNAGRLVPLESHPLRADALPEGHPARVSEGYAEGYTDVYTMPGEPQTPLGATDLEIAAAGGQGQSDVDATDAAVELADSEGIDLADVEGTGRDGKVTKGDVEDYIASRENG